MKKKITITIPAQKPRRHFAPTIKVIPNKKKNKEKKSCRTKGKDTE